MNRLLYDVPENEYHRMPGLSSTGAKKLLKSPAHYQHYVTHAEEPKAAFDLGSAVHTKVLGVGADIAIYPDGPGASEYEWWDGEDTVLSKTGTTGTNAAREFETLARENGLIPVKRVVAHVVNKIAESVLRNQTARALLEGGHPEVSMLATDPTTGVLGRGRLDYLGKRITDLKTMTGDATEAGFSRQVFNLGYHIQFGYYELLYQIITGETPPWLWVVAETEAPYLTNVFVLGEDEQRIGRDMARDALETYARCRDANHWGGYTNMSGGPIGIVRAPVWSINEYIDQHQDDAA